MLVQKALNGRCFLWRTQRYPRQFVDFRRCVQRKATKQSEGTEEKPEASKEPTNPEKDGQGKDEDTGGKENSASKAEASKKDDKKAEQSDESEKVQCLDLHYLHHARLLFEMIESGVVWHAGRQSLRRETDC